MIIPMNTQECLEQRQFEAAMAAQQKNLNNPYINGVIPTGRVPNQYGSNLDEMRRVYQLMCQQQANAEKEKEECKLKKLTHDEQILLLTTEGR